MYPELFRIPLLNIPIFSYGLMMVIGFLCATQLAKFLAKRTGVDAEFFVNAGLIALVTGVIGARMSHVVENWHVYTDPTRTAWANFVDAINIRSGGLTYYGGVILATPCTIAYGLWKKAPLLHSMDVIAPALMIGLAFGRIGCFLNGCCYGAQCDVPWAVTFPFGSNAYVEEYDKGLLPAAPDELLVDTTRGPQPRTVAEVNANAKLRALAATHRSNPVHPAQLYSAFTAFLLAGLLTAVFTLPHAQGSIFMLMMVLEGSSRFVLELLRAEPAVAETSLGGMSFSMIISLGLVIAGIIGMLVVRKLPQRKEVLTHTPSKSKSSPTPVPA
jgi:phosphatidylglycerol:prolipoprotein diacylglycerol transferase